MNIVNFNGEDVVLVNVIREGRNAWSEVYAVPVNWAINNKIKQYNWEDTTSVPDDIYEKLLKLPKINITRIWDA